MKTLFGACAVFAVASMSACSAADDGVDATNSAAVVEVQVSNNQFTPPSVTVKAGQTVRWTWAGGTHNVVSGADCSTDDGNFKSGAPQAGGTFEKKFEAAGTFPYHCEVHCAMGMKGEVIVQ